MHLRTIPLYGLQARGIDGTTQPPTSVRDMAAEYIEQIRAVQEVGPYHLLGWSFGGVVAQEIAFQLQTEGHQVAALICMDAYPGNQGEIADSIGDEKEIAGEAEDPSAELQDEADRLARYIRREQGRMTPDISDEQIMAIVKIRQNSTRIAFTHKPRRFEGDLLLITALEDRARPGDTSVWTPYISGKISEFGLPCTHNEMARPDMLAKVWHCISSWLGLKDGGAAEGEG
jgi:thioesterase domain-containing protein